MAGKCDSFGRSDAGKGPQPGKRKRRNAATAVNHGIQCHCGKGTKRQCRSQTPWRGMQRNRASATAPNPGICCRCGNKTETFTREYWIERWHSLSQNHYFCILQKSPSMKKNNYTLGTAAALLIAAWPSLNLVVTFRAVKLIYFTHSLTGFTGSVFYL